MDLSDERKINPDELNDDEVIRYEKEKTTFERKMKDELIGDKIEVEQTQSRSPGDYAKGGPYIYYQWCKACGICIEVCPKDVLAFDENNNVYQKDPDACIHCLRCDMLCPDFAITGYLEKDE